MKEVSDRLTTALADRYRLERELGQGGMVRERVTEVILKDSLTVAARLMSLKRRWVGAGLCPAQDRVREMPVGPGAASAADTGAHPDA